MKRNLIRVLMGGFEYVVDADYQAPDPGNSECPPTDEGYDIGQIYWSDGKTPVALTDRQVETLEQIMLANLHAEQDYVAYCDRYAD